MAKKTSKSETVKVSRLGCMRRSTVEKDVMGGTVEHVEVWTTEDLINHRKRPAPKDKQ